MWMVGYNNDDGEYNVAHESFHGRKHRPLVPRPVSSNNATTSAVNPSLNIFHGNDLFPQYHNLAHVTEQSKCRELDSQPVVMSSSRWNPAPEQLRALEELYHRGTRTPSAEQIQNITAQLRRFGKIEGKNVFYWFQNHKARERQKRRRQMESSANQAAGYRNNMDHIAPKKESGGRNRSAFEGDQTKNNRRTAKATVAEYRPDVWTQFDEAELKQRSFAERNGMWQRMQLSCPTTHPPAAAAATHLINTAAAATWPAHTITSITGSTRALDPKLNRAQHDDDGFSKAPYRANIGLIHLNSINDMVDQDNCVESQTLQLFPLGGDGSEEIYDKEGSELSLSAAMNANFSTQSHFFEFLPLKN